MRDLFEDGMGASPLDPNEAARRTMRSLRRRFYASAEVVPADGGFAVTLDGRPLRTPARRPLVAPVQAVAQALADEWRAQGEMIDPAAMPLTRLANSIVDGVADGMGAVAADIVNYLGTDMLFYRADAPEGLVARQAATWDPVLAWAAEKFGARFMLSEGIVHVRQPDTAIAAVRGALPSDPWRLGALHAATTLTGSALLALALLEGRLTADEAWQAAHVDEDWNWHLWGRDQLAEARRAARWREMQAAARVLTPID